jgi:hypothetical protein
MNHSAIETALAAYFEAVLSALELSESVSGVFPGQSAGEIDPFLPYCVVASGDEQHIVGDLHETVLSWYLLTPATVPGVTLDDHQALEAALRAALGPALTPARALAIRGLAPYIPIGDWLEGSSSERQGDHWVTVAKLRVCLRDSTASDLEIQDQLAAAIGDAAVSDSAIVGAAGAAGISATQWSQMTIPAAAVQLVTNLADTPLYTVVVETVTACAAGQCISVEAATSALLVVVPPNGHAVGAYGDLTHKGLVKVQPTEPLQDPPEPPAPPAP